MNASNASRGIRRVLYLRLRSPSVVPIMRTPLRFSKCFVIVSCETRRIAAASLGVRYSGTCTCYLSVPSITGCLPLPHRSTCNLGTLLIAHPVAVSSGGRRCQVRKNPNGGDGLLGECCEMAVSIACPASTPRLATRCPATPRLAKSIHLDGSVCEL